MNIISSPMGVKGTIRVYYWRGAKGRCESNFGDALSPLIISKILGRNTVYATPSRADIMGIGSVLGHASHMWRRPLLGRTNPLYVWGTGTLLPVRVCTRFMKFLAVRGSKTRDLLRLDYNMSLGDPGLLASLLLPNKPQPRFSVGVIPHWEERSHPVTLESIQRIPHSKLIDVTSPYPLETIRTIASCESVLSSSLHGLVVADAFGVPNARFRCLKTKGTNNWKYQDYCSSVKRTSLPVVDLSTIGKLNDLEGSLGCANLSVVAEISKTLIKLLRGLI